jgi:hypothetical protein
MPADANKEREKTESQRVPSPVCAWLAASLRELQDEAKLLVDDYWRRLKEGRTHQKRYAQGSVGVRLRARDTGGFSIEWYEMGRLGGSGRFVAKKQFSKGRRSHRYALDQALKSEPDWVAELVRETEEVFADIRKRQALLVRIRDSLIAYESEASGQTVTAEAIIRRGIQASTDAPKDEDSE